MKALLVDFIKGHWREIYNYLRFRLYKKFGKKAPLMPDGDLTTSSDFDPRDFPMSVGEAMNKPAIFRDFIYMLDQGLAYDKAMSCGPTSVYCMLCNNLNVTPTYKEWVELLQHLEDLGIFHRRNGSSIPAVVKEVAKWWNAKHPDRKVTYYRLKYTDAAIKELLEKGYFFVGGYNTFSAYTRDRSDRIINNSNYPGWTRAGGHATTAVLGKNIIPTPKVEVMHSNKHKTKSHTYNAISNNIHILDSYPTSHGDKNIYEHEKIFEHSKNGIWYSWFYTFVAEDPQNIKEELIKEGSSSQYAINELSLRKERLEEPISRFESFSVAGRALQRTDNLFVQLHDSIKGLERKIDFLEDQVSKKPKEEKKYNLMSDNNEDS